eukprot:24174-Chlamydomonas_euryale.AAC.1
MWHAAGARAAAGRTAGVASHAAERPATISLRMTAGRGRHAGPRGGLAGGEAAHASIGDVLVGGRRLQGPRAHATLAASVAAMTDVVGVPVYHRAHSGRCQRATRADDPPPWRRRRTRCQHGGRGA